MKKIFKSYTFNITLIVALTAFVVWFALKDNYKEMAQIFSQIEVRWIFVILVFVFLMNMFAGIILTRLTKLSNPHYSYKDGFVCTLVGALVSGITPSSTGGQVAQIYAFKKQGVPISDSASVLWMDFILYQTILCGLVSVLFILRFTYFFNHYSQMFIFALIGFIVNAALIVGLWAVAKFPKVYTFITTKGMQICCKLKMIKDPEKSLNNLHIQLAKFNSEILKLKGHRSLIIQCCLLHLVRLLVYYSIPFITFIALGIEVNSANFIDCLALASFVSMINAFIPIPGASGGTEITFVLMFSTLFGTLAAKTTMLVWRFMTFYLVLMLGVVAFFYIKFKKDYNSLKGD